MEEMVVDLRTGAVTRPCGGDRGCTVVGRFLADGKGVLRDLVSGASLALSPTAEEWDAVPQVGPPCP
jgi:hypothetical protein